MRNHQYVTLSVEYLLSVQACHRWEWIRYLLPIRVSTNPEDNLIIAENIVDKYIIAKYLDPECLFTDRYDCNLLYLLRDASWLVSGMDFLSQATEEMGIASDYSHNSIQYTAQSSSIWILAQCLAAWADKNSENVRKKKRKA